jgi:hypothetical protein
VTGIVTISPDEYAAMPGRFDGEWLRDNFPDASRSMERFIDKIKQDMQSKMVKNNKDLFQLLDDPRALLDKLHIY